MVCLDKHNLLLHCTASTREEAIRAISARMADNGYIGDTYCDAVLAREKDYPTGLPTDDVATALPHANCPDVLKTGVGVARLKTPVEFYSMADSSETLPVQMVFLLASTPGSGAHLQELQELMGCFCRVGLLRDLMNAADEQEFIRIFNNREQYEES